MSQLFYLTILIILFMKMQVSHMLYLVIIRTPLTNTTRLYIDLKLIMANQNILKEY